MVATERVNEGESTASTSGCGQLRTVKVASGKDCSSASAVVGDVGPIKGSF
jgi:hypothetical protein